MAARAEQEVGYMGNDNELCAFKKAIRKDSENFHHKEMLNV